MNTRPLRLVSFLAPLLAPFYADLADHLTHRLDRFVELVQAERFDAAAYDAFADGDGDLALICGLPYVWLRDRRPRVEALAAPVPDGLRYGGRPWYYSDVLVRRGDGRGRLEELGGAAWGYNEPGSLSGCGVVAFELERRGLTWEHFGTVVELGDHVTAIEALVDGLIDGVAVDSHLLEVLGRRRPDLAGGVRTIEVLGPSTIQPIVASAHLRDEVRRHVQGVLLGYGRDPVSEEVCRDVGIERFVAVGDGDYDDVRRMARTAQPLLDAVPA